MIKGYKINKYTQTYGKTRQLISEFLATDPEVLGSVPGASRFSEKQRVWYGVHSAS
jgi:hypothetical protein